MHLKLSTSQQQSKRVALNLQKNNPCFHCNEPIPPRTKIHANIDGDQLAVCCHGCKAVAEFIHEGNYSDFYQYRGDTHPASKSLITEKKWLSYDETNTFNAHVNEIQDGLYTVSITVDGIYCSACGWLIDRHLKGQKGIVDVKLNAITRLLKVTFSKKDIELSQILTAINYLGYQPVLTTDDSSETTHKERNDSLKRLLIAGLGMMFVMTISVPLYGAEYSDMDPAIKRFFLLLSMLLSTGVYFYSGKIFIKNALRDISNKHLGMDVPVAISITIAYTVSCWIVLSESQQVTYFDSMVMFIFFLLSGRFIEMTVRHQGMDVNEALGQMIPTSVKLYQQDKYTHVPYDILSKGDVIQLDPGDIVPTDGTVVKVLDGQPKMNESMITGESISVAKNTDDKVMAGCYVDSGVLLVKCTSIGNDTILAGLSEMLENAQMQKPKTYQVMGNIASWFVVAVLLLAGSTLIYNYLYNPDEMIPIVLAVLVATCPCALSLATPAAFTASSVKLMKSGVLVNNLDAISHINKVNNWFFDKTGTLTEAHMSVANIHNFSDKTDMELLKLMASIEHQVVHPIASAFNDFYDGITQSKIINNQSTNGIEAEVNNTIFKCGDKSWCEVPDSTAIDSDLTVVYLRDSEKLLAAFELTNKLRSGANQLMQFLKAKHQNVSVISGDKKQVVEKVVTNLNESINIQNTYYEKSPSDKMDTIINQQKSSPVIMVGDGVNDAPVLAQADVSISFNQATQLARAASDFIIMGQSLRGIKDLIHISHNTHQIIRQNITWAILYNISITPLAIMGYLTPWMAAIGMSVSSLFVVLNAKRILWQKSVT